MPQRVRPTSGLEAKPPRLFRHVDLCVFTSNQKLGRRGFFWAAKKSVTVLTSCEEGAYPTTNSCSVRCYD